MKERHNPATGPLFFDWRWPNFGLENMRLRKVRYVTLCLENDFVYTFFDRPEYELVIE